MRVFTLILAILIGLLQYPLWLGKGSWLKAWEVDQELNKQNSENAKLKARNASLDAEVRDLKTGYEAIEERARSELGMIKQDETFFQVLDAPRSSVSTIKPVEGVNPILPASGATPAQPRQP